MFTDDFIHHPIPLLLLVPYAYLPKLHVLLFHFVIPYIIKNGWIPLVLLVYAYMWPHLDGGATGS